MTKDDMERTMEFILNQQAKNEVEIQELKETTKLQGKAIEELRVSVHELRESIHELRESMREQSERMEAGFAETRWAIVKILEASEENKAITTQLAELAVQTSRLAKASEKRLTQLEKRVEKLEKSDKR